MVLVVVERGDGRRLRPADHGHELRTSAPGLAGSRRASGRRDRRTGRSPPRTSASSPTRREQVHGPLAASRRATRRPSSGSPIQTNSRMWKICIRAGSPDGSLRKTHELPGVDRSRRRRAAARAWRPPGRPGSRPPAATTRSVIDWYCAPVLVLARERLLLEGLLLGPVEREDAARQMRERGEVAVGLDLPTREDAAGTASPRRCPVGRSRRPVREASRMRVEVAPLAVHARQHRSPSADRGRTAQRGRPPVRRGTPDGARPSDVLGDQQQAGVRLVDPFVGDHEAGADIVSRRCRPTLNGVSFL